MLFWSWPIRAKPMVACAFASRPTLDMAVAAGSSSSPRQAAHFKKTPDEVKAPRRVEQVIGRVRELSRELGANPAVTEQIYRALISAFVKAEQAEHAAINEKASKA